MTLTFSTSTLIDWLDEQLAYIATQRAALDDQTSKLATTLLAQEAVLNSVLASVRSAGKMKKVDALRIFGTYIGKGRGEDQIAAHARSAIKRGLRLTNDVATVAALRSRIERLREVDGPTAEAMSRVLEQVAKNGVARVSLNAIVVLAKTQPVV